MAPQHQDDTPMSVAPEACFGDDSDDSVCGGRCESTANATLVQKAGLMARRTKPSGKRLLSPPPCAYRATKARTWAATSPTDTRAIMAPIPIKAIGGEMIDNQRPTAPVMRKRKTVFAIHELRAIGARSVQATKQEGQGPAQWTVSDYEDHPQGMQRSPAATPTASPSSSPPSSPRNSRPSSPVDCGKRSRSGSSSGAEDSGSCSGYSSSGGYSSSSVTSEELQSKIERDALLLLQLLQCTPEKDAQGLVRQSMLGNMFKEKYPHRFQRGLVKVLVKHLLERGLVLRTGPGGGNVFVSVTPHAELLLSTTKLKQLKVSDSPGVAAKHAAKYTIPPMQQLPKPMSQSQPAQPATGGQPAGEASGQSQTMHDTDDDLDGSSMSSGAELTSSSAEEAPLPDWIKSPQRDMYSPPSAGTQMTGTVVTIQNTFGFICVEGMAEDLFFHTSSLKPGEWPEVNQRVLFYTKMNTQTGFVNAVHVRFLPEDVQRQQQRAAPVSQGVSTQPTSSRRRRRRRQKRKQRRQQNQGQPPRHSHGRRSRFPSTSAAVGNEPLAWRRRTPKLTTPSHFGGSYGPSYSHGYGPMPSPSCTPSCQQGGQQPVQPWGGPGCTASSGKADCSSPPADCYTAMRWDFSSCAQAQQSVHHRQLYQQGGSWRR